MNTCLPRSPNFEVDARSASAENTIFWVGGGGGGGRVWGMVPQDIFKFTSSQM